MICSTNPSLDTVLEKGQQCGMWLDEHSVTIGQLTAVIQLSAVVNFKGNQALITQENVMEELSHQHLPLGGAMV